MNLHFILGDQLNLNISSLFDIDAKEDVIVNSILKGPQRTVKDSGNLSQPQASIPNDFRDY